MSKHQMATMIVYIKNQNKITKKLKKNLEFTYNWYKKSRNENFNIRC